MQELDLTELRTEGYLQEVNRRFFHPLGMALCVTTDDDGSNGRLSVLDDREDPEGWFFRPTPQMRERAARVADIEHSRFVARTEALGYWIQPRP